MKRRKAPLDFTQRVRVLHIRSGRDDSVWHGTHSDYLSTSSNHRAANSHQSSRLGMPRQKGEDLDCSLIAEFVKLPSMHGPMGQTLLEI